MRASPHALWALVLIGCGAPETGPSGRDLSGAIERWEEPPAAPRARDAIAARDGETATSISRADRGSSRGGHAAHLVDVRFDEADLVNALRFLADEARLSLVVGDGVSGRVSDRLARVDAYRALVTIARAHGANVERKGDVVIVRSD